MKFYQNRVCRVTVAAVDGVQEAFYRAIEKINPLLTTLPEIHKLVEEIPNNYAIGVRCSPFDKWDEAKGRRIAQARLLKGYYAMQTKFLEKVGDLMYNLAGKIYDSSSVSLNRQISEGKYERNLIFDEE